MSGIQGQVLRMSQRREVAIYLRKGTLWVADFIDGDGELVEAATWFRFNCGAPSTYHARRRMVQESAIPLSPALVNRIEALHRPTPAAKNYRALLPRDDDARRPRPRSGIARFFRRLLERPPVNQTDPARTGDTSLRTYAQPAAARMQPAREPREIELHSYEENGR